MIARRTSVRMTYNNKDITADISDYIKSFEYIDNSHGAIDTITMSVHDTDRLWQSDWYPGKNAIVKCYIDQMNEQERVKSMYCGAYRLDELSLSGPPQVFTFSGVSNVDESGIRMTKKSRAWEGMQLKAIAAQIASEHGLGFWWESVMNMGTDTGSGLRFDQRDESDLSFLKRNLDSWAHSVKLAEEKLIIYYEENFEDRSPAFTLKREDVSSYSFKSKGHDIYTSCVITYTDPETSKTEEYIYQPENAPKSGQTLKVNARVKSSQAAEQKAKSALYRANKFEVTGTIGLAGSLDIKAAFPFILTGFGEFDGKYFIDKCRHIVGGGFKTSLEVHKV